MQTSSNGCGVIQSQWRITSILLFSSPLPTFSLGRASAFIAVTGPRPASGSHPQAHLLHAPPKASHGSVPPSSRGSRPLGLRIHLAGGRAGLLPGASELGESQVGTLWKILEGRGQGKDRALLEAGPVPRGLLIQAGDRCPRRVGTLPASEVCAVARCPGMNGGKADPEAVLTSSVHGTRYHVQESSSYDCLQTQDSRSALGLR